MAIECLVSLASYWQRMKHREPGFLHQPAVKLCFALCSAGHWLKPLLRQEGQRSEVKGQWRAGSSGVSQPLSWSLLPASWAVAMSFWVKMAQLHSWLLFFFLSQHCSVVNLTQRSALMTLTCFPLWWKNRWVGGLLNIPSSALIFWPSAANLIPSYVQMEELPPPTTWADTCLLLHLLLHSQSITTVLII